MAKANSTLIDSPLDRLKVREYSWGKIYQGTQSDLVGARLVKAEWFPGSGTSKTATRVGMIDGEMKVLPFGRPATREQEEKGVVRIFKANQREYKAYINFSKEHLDRQRLKQEVERQHAEKKKALDAAPKSPEAFRDVRGDDIRFHLEGAWNCFMRALNGYHYSKEVFEKAHDLICDLVELADNGKVYLDPKRRQYFLDDIERKAEKAHPEFSAFLKATIAIGKAACP